MKALLLEGSRRRLLTLRFHPSKDGHPNDMEEQAWHRLGDAAPLQHVWQDIPLFPGAQICWPGGCGTRVCGHCHVRRHRRLDAFNCASCGLKLAINDCTHVSRSLKPKP